MKHLKLKVLPQALLSTLGMGVAATLAMTPIAFAQTTGSNVPAKPTQKVEKIEVTGSNIKRIDTETAAPVTIIKREDIEKTGFSSVAELLRSLPSSSQVGGVVSDLTGNNSFSGGASSVNLRGLGGSSTLVLVNGRRIAPFGLANPNAGQTTFVNIDSLPLAVIDRVEILRDGASAIYGSDAIAGVINFITRKDFTGVLARVGASQNNLSEYQSRTATFTAGYGDIAENRYNVFFNAEVLQRDETRFRAVEAQLINDPRNFSLFGVGRASSSFAGNYYRVVSTSPTTGLILGSAFVGNNGICAKDPRTFVNAAGTCIYDQWPGNVIAPKLDRLTTFTRGTMDISANLSLFSEFSFSKTKTQFTNNPPVIGAGAFGQYFQASTGKVISPPEIMPVGHPSNPFTFPVSLRHRFTELGEGQSILNSDATRFVVGAKFTAGAWDMESAFSASGNKNEALRTKVLALAPLQEAILRGGYNFLSPETGRLKPSDLTIDTKDKGKSSSTGIDFRASSELFQMPAGGVGIALGADFRKDKFSVTPDQRIIEGQAIGNGASSADGSRNAFALFAEINVPLFKTLEAQLALRTDKFSDYGRSTTPKAAIVWTAAPGLKVRSSYTEGFRAPSLTEISKSSVSAFNNGYFDDLRCSTRFPGQPLNPPGNTDCTTGYSLATFIEASPDLKPETAKSKTVGFAWEPTKDTLLTVDYFRITRVNEIAILGLDDLVDDEANGSVRYPGRLVRDVNDTDGRPGRILTARRGYLNFAGTDVQGLDVDFTQQINLSAYGKLSINAAASYFFNYRNSDENKKFTDFSGVRTVPRTRATLSATWEYRDFAFTPIARYIGRTAATTSTFAPCNVNVPDICKVGAISTLDLNASYRGIKNLTLRAGITNITRKTPPWTPGVGLGFQPVLSGQTLFGQVASLSAEYKFK